ncbi:MAG: glycogen/starch synthase [Patescibacteria group bacterium]|nr:glycogen/starch synthase [Patescibacteria group bacterium]MDD5554074.1 glycogen/starch synthase [Patescibacteria group bacterium]
MKKGLKILMAASEMAPLAKVGGLADVVGSLPPALARLGCDVRVALPAYGSIDKKKIKAKKILSNIAVASAGQDLKINLWQTKASGITVYLLDCQKYFGGEEIYSGNKKIYTGTEDSERFLFFSLAILKVLPLIKFKPDIIHSHDFHTALIPNLLKADQNPYYKNTKTLYTIHNLNHQGKSEIKILSTGNLNKDSLKSLSRDAQDGDINFMVQGIINADLVNTVSPTYAKEIATSIYGAGIEKVIRQNRDKISGILNGIDVSFFNPAKDKLIKQNYTFKTLEKKVENKLALQKRLGLEQNKNIPLAGLVSRLAWQKGLELITENEAKLTCQFVFLGTGEKKYENQLKKIAKKYPDKISAQITFDIKLAQQIYAASDIFLMPSRFEPCGLGQMIAMRYGAVPIVRSTGGLADTVNKKLGFSFSEFTSVAFTKTLKDALNLYYKKPRKWKKMQKRGMKKDFSWRRSAKDYLKLYKKLINK